MRAKLVHHSVEWLEGDFEPPPSPKKRQVLTVWRLHSEPSTGLKAMKVTGGAGVWDAAGRRLFYIGNGADVAWPAQSAGCFSLENSFSPCRGDRHGVGHVLRLRDASTFEPVRQADLCVPTGGMEYLVIDDAGSTALATWLDQTQWGYVGVDLATMTQSLLEFSFPTPSLSPPAFSPHGELIVSCSHSRSGWWTDVVDDYWQSPSPGGPRKVGTISVQSLASRATSHHDLFVHLPPGWIPDRPSAGEWSMIWGPEFVSPGTFRVWLPDQSSEVLTLPLPQRIDVTRPLRTVRTWVD